MGKNSVKPSTTPMRAAFISNAMSKYVSGGGIKSSQIMRVPFAAGAAV
jgi:hypothetical protein